MSQYSYQAPAGMASGGQPPQLTPLYNLPTHPYQQNSPGPPPQLPPLHGPGHSFPSQLYRPAAGQQSLQQSQHQNGRMSITPETSHLSSQQESVMQYNNQQAHHPNGQAQTAQLPHPSSFSSATASQPPGTFNSVGGHPSGSLFSSGPYTQQLSLPTISSSLYGPSQRQSPAPSYSSQSQQNLSQQDNQAADARILPLVGPQGRRGLLPSAPDQITPSTVVQDSSSRSSLTVPKNPDGKYPCSYCNKTYQHLKHLKRHLLRHTGERPYSCALCQETFCRSDILKRHFQKCQLRRGNPNGVTHLTYAHAHKRSQQQQQAQQSQQQQQHAPVGQHLPQPQSQHRQDAGHVQSHNLPDVRTSNIGPPSIAGSTGSARPSWTNGQTNYSPAQFGADSNQLQPSAIAFDSNRSSRSSSILRTGSANSEDRKRYSGATSHTSASTGISMNTSPSTGLTLNPMHAPEAKPNGLNPPSAYRDRMSTSSYQDHQNEPSSFFHSNTVPPMSIGSQAESSSSFQYGRPSFPHYNGNHSGSHVNESWSTYFQPVAQSDVMFSS